MIRKYQIFYNSQNQSNQLPKLRSSIRKQRNIAPWVTSVPLQYKTSIQSHHIWDNRRNTKAGRQVEKKTAGRHKAVDMTTTMDIFLFPAISLNSL